MDLWVVAALTGAGYAAKYLQSISREKEGLASTGSACDIPSLTPQQLSSSVPSRHNRMQCVRPLNSLESCVMAQICEERSQAQGRVLAPLPSPCLRPFVVTDGTRVISRPSLDSCMVADTDNTGKGRAQRLSSIGEMPSKTQMSLQVPPSGAALFCLGVSIGVTYSTLANKREVIKLKDVLKQTENLVQDLEEELEMKDSLTVNQLVSVDDERECSIDNKKPMVTRFQSDSQVLVNYGDDNSDTHKAPGNLESMNQIEAELEAELERLELNMRGSTLHTKSSDGDVELDAEIVAELIQGEFGADILSIKPSSDPSRGGGSSSSTTPCSPKQSVSPRDLSLRLHQVIQSRLEQRIMELETALEKSQRRVKHLESGQGPITVEAERELPLVMNLSGDALEAYNEAFEELSKINGSEYGSPNSAVCEESPEKELSSRSLLELGPTLVDGDAYTTSCTTSQKRELFSFDGEGDENDDTVLLIRQIVEKTRQGSSAILHAHRAMVSLDSSRNDDTCFFGWV